MRESQPLAGLSLRLRLARWFRGLGRASSYLFTPLALLPLISCSHTSNPLDPTKELTTYQDTNFRLRGSYAIVDEELARYKHEEPINYLAIGDSISQGFFSIPMVAGPGSLDNQGNVVGVSYPVYLVNLINRLQPGKVAVFNNLSLAGSTVYN